MRRNILFSMLLVSMATMSSAAVASGRLLSKITPPAPASAFSPVASAGSVELELPESTAAGTCSVICHLQYDKDKYMPYAIGVRSASTVMDSPGSAGMKTTVLNVAPGTYDMFVIFIPYNPDLSGSMQWDFYSPKHLVIKEQVEVSEDLELTFDETTASNYIEFSAVTPDGEDFKYPVFDGQSQDYTKANIAFETTATTISCSTYGELTTAYGTGCHCTPEGKSTSNAFNLYINDLSDRYSITQCRMAVSTNNELYIVTSESGVKPGGAKVTNAGQGYDVITERFQQSPMYDQLPKELYRSGIHAYAYVNGLTVTHFDYLSAYEFPTAYMSWSEGVSPERVKYTLWPKIFEMDHTVDGTDQRVQLLMHGCPIDVTVDNKTYANSINKYFNCPVDNVPGIMGDNVPVSCVIMHSVDAGNGNRAILYAPSIIGRYSERRETDLSMLDVEVCYNGTPVCTSLSELNTWANTWATDGHEPGVMTTTFTNTNINVAGLQGKNVTEITYTEGKNDMCAPTVQMLAFSDNAGRLTDRFAAGSEVKVNVAAGDANGNGRRYSYMDAKEVKLEYAPYGTGKFVNVAMDYVQGATSLASWSVYGGSIAGPSGSANGWYDVRITVVDNEHNRSVQTLSPAFKVYDASSAVDELPADNAVSVYCDGGVLHIQGIENPSAEIYAVGGYRVMSASGNEIDLSSLAPGMYMVRLGNETYKVMLKD